MKIIDAVLGFFKPTVVEKEREVKVVRLDAVDSTNAYLRTYTPAEDEPMTVVVADYQTAGKGQGTNTWESEAGKNLLFSVLVHPTMLPVRSQFLLSEAGALALKEALTDYVKDDISLIIGNNDCHWLIFSRCVSAQIGVCTIDSIQSYDFHLSFFLYYCWLEKA